ncbi:MAG: hypothetical protein J6C46_01770 [Clostridia bacterium]|nr:hypothetical protein [Clostridia bacterium]
MVTKLNKNVLVVQDVPSNLIEEVILILRTEDKKIKNKTKDILMVEAKEIINDCSVKLQTEYDDRKRAEREEENKKKRQKMNLLTVAGFMLFTIAIVLITNMLQ